MPTKAEQDAEKIAANLEAEIDELARRRGDAIAQIHHAEERFVQLEERRTVLSPKAFSGDKEATAELEQMEDEHDRIARSVRVARSAVPEFDRMTSETRERLAEARVRVHRERADELARQSEALDGERDQLAARLAEILEEQTRLDFERSHQVRAFDGDEANRITMNSAPGTRAWLEGAFARWLG